MCYQLNLPGLDLKLLHGLPASLSYQHPLLTLAYSYLQIGLWHSFPRNPCHTHGPQIHSSGNSCLGATCSGFYSESWLPNSGLCPPGTPASHQMGLSADQAERWEAAAASLLPLGCKKISELGVKLSWLVFRQSVKKWPYWRSGSTEGSSVRLNPTDVTARVWRPCVRATHKFRPSPLHRTSYSREGHQYQPPLGCVCNYYLIMPIYGSMCSYISRKDKCGLVRNPIVTLSNQYSPAAVLLPFMDTWRRSHTMWIDLLPAKRLRLEVTCATSGPKPLGVRCTSPALPLS